MQAPAKVRSQQQIECWNWGTLISELDLSSERHLSFRGRDGPLLAISTDSTMMAVMQGIQPSTKTQCRLEFFGNTPELLGVSSLDSICLQHLQGRADLQGSAVGLSSVPGPQNV